MNKFLNRDRIIALVCMAFSGWIFYESGNFPKSEWDAIGPSLYPRFLAAVIGIASVIMFLTRKSTGDTTENTVPHFIPFFYIVGVSAAYIAVLNILGFIISTMLFLLAMVLYFEPSEMKVRVRKAVVYSVVFSLFLYFFFGKLLGVLLPNPSFM